MFVLIGTGIVVVDVIDDDPPLNLGSIHPKPAEAYTTPPPISSMPPIEIHTIYHVRGVAFHVEGICLPSMDVQSPGTANPQRSICCSKPIACCHSPVREQAAIVAPKATASALHKAGSRLDSGVREVCHF